MELGKRGAVVSQAGSAAEGEERVEVIVYLRQAVMLKLLQTRCILRA